MVDSKPNIDLLVMMDNPETQTFHSPEKLQKWIASSQYVQILNSTIYAIPDHIFFLFYISCILTCNPSKKEQQGQKHDRASHCFKQ